MRFARYLSWSLVRLAVTAALILAFIAEILDLVDNAGDILDQGQGVLGILRYVALRLPTLVTHALPLGALVGALISIAILARNSEIVAMRAAGRSTWNIFAMMLPGALVLVVLHSTLLDVVLPRTETRLAVWLTQKPEDEKAEENVKPVWLRVGDAVVSFDRVSGNGKRLRNLRIYDRDATKIVTARIIAPEARYDDGRWILKGSERVSWTRDTLNERRSADGPWETTLTPDDVLSALTPENRVSLTAARAVLAGRQTPNAPLAFYQTLVERVYAAPLSAIVMVLLAMPASLVNWRDARTGRNALAALAAGLSYLLVDGMLTTLGMTGVIGPVGGAWSALVIFAAFGAWRIYRIDSGWGPPRSLGVADQHLAGARG